MVEDDDGLVKLNRIIKEVAAEHDIAVGILVSADRHWPLNEWRRKLCWRLVTETDAPLAGIARVMRRCCETIIYQAALYAQDNKLPPPRGCTWTRQWLARRNARARLKQHRGARRRRTG